MLTLWSHKGYMRQSTGLPTDLLLPGMGLDGSHKGYKERIRLTADFNSSY